MAPTNGYDLIRWANRTPKVPSDRYVGTERVRRILVDLALNSDRHWTTYVSRRRLADDLDIDQRIVGRALTLLANAGLIVATERDGRGMSRWRLCPDFDIPTGGDSTPKRGDSTRGDSTPTGGDSTPFGGDPTTPDFGDSTPFGGATGGATGGDSTHPHLSKTSRSGSGVRPHARTPARVREANNTPTQNEPESTPELDQPTKAPPAADREQPFDPATATPFCDRHPGGTSAPCRGCQHAAARYERDHAAWTRTRCRRDGCDEPIDPVDPSYRLCARHVALRVAGQ